ncbi:hypothetical protein RND81_14G141000 [Saponaria officinalis]|uniref:CCHC-type domain-containing protein n=1 Tax=Saponaria officinalis TaxID=3572 RepID=A0AAW1GN06_SAPOF
MFMYSTICKQLKNSDSNIAKMIISGFTGQLKGWWDNYLTPAMKTSICDAKTTGENPVENTVYTLTINIIEQFTGRFLNNNENIRTLLQNLRCKTLTDYRWYKDTFLSRVMELPESSSSHWKAKFIDGLPHLFAERVRTVLRGQHNCNTPYGKLIGTCTEQGLKLCNEIKLTQQIKRQNLTERNQLGDFCDQFGIDMPYPSHKKRKTFKDSNSKPFYKRKRNKPFIKRNQYDKPGKNPVTPYFKRNFKNKPNNKIVCFKCNKIGHYAQDCWTKKSISTLEIDDTIKDKLYKLFLKSDSEEIDSSSSNNEIKKMDNDSYFSDSSDSTCEPCPQIDNIDNLNEPINKELLTNNIPNNHFLQAMDTFISQKWLINITLKIDLFFTKDLTALIDSGADQNVIQEGLIPTRYFEKTTHGLSHAGGNKLKIEYKLPEASICVDNKCMPVSFLLVKNKLTKEILAIVKCVLKFQDDLYNQHFTIKSDCKAAKFMFLKDFKHDVSKQMFARWQAHLAPFDFKIVYKKGRGNPSYRGGSSSRGRGRGRGNYIADHPNPIVQHGNKKLIASDISGITTDNAELEEFYQWKNLQKGKEDASKSLYANAVKKTSPAEVDMLPNNEERVILFLSESDKKWADKPWTLFDRYLKSNGYTMEVYKSPLYYEEILASNNCTFTHFSGANKEIYNFSKIIIGSVISINDWGISPLTEKSVTLRGNLIKYNYWDYIQAFDKVFLYDNDKKSHTWFIKISSDVYNTDLPSWLINWWSFYGTSANILPSIFRDLFDEWQGIISYIISPEEIIFSYHMRFFIEFFIPYIWISCPTTGYTNKLFCLKRKSFSKFWDTMSKKDQEGQLNCQLTLSAIKEKITSYTKIKQIEEDKLKAKEKEKLLYFSDDDNELDIDFSGSSDTDIIKAYMDALKKTLKAKNEEDDYVNSMKRGSASDTSMASNKSHSSLKDLVQDAHDPNEDSQLEKIKAYLEIN